MSAAEITPYLIIGALFVVAAVGWLRSRRRQESALEQMRTRRQAPEEVMAQAESLAASGRKVEAIAALRAATGMGLAEAKASVEQLSAGRGAIVTGGPIELPANLDGTIRGLLKNGEKIEAIKLVREKTGLDLMDSKDLVDRIERGRE